MAEYMIIKNDIISEIFCGGEAVAGAIELPKSHEVRAGEPLTYYNSDYTRKSQVQLIKENLTEMPAGYKIENDKLVEMSRDEKIIAGLEPLPSNMKIVDGQIVPKTAEEIFADMSDEEKASYIRMQRDGLINEADTILLKYQEQVELGVIEQDDSYRLAILQYKESLRNVPEQAGFPVNVAWPELPARV